VATVDEVKNKVSTTQVVTVKEFMEKQRDLIAKVLPKTITPDRMLTRQVTATLDRWGIVPDDSAGKPLALSAPGRLLRHVAALFGRALTPEALPAGASFEARWLDWYHFFLGFNIINIYILCNIIVFVNKLLEVLNLINHFSYIVHSFYFIYKYLKRNYPSHNFKSFCLVFQSNIICNLPYWL
jgi:hypothetical protein